MTSVFSTIFATQLSLVRRKFSIEPITFQRRSRNYSIDKSKLPVLKEEDLEETFIKGSGPGGSNVNKTVSCVTLKHKPSGIILKCQFSRLLQENRKIARERLIEKLDNFYNGDMSISAQKERILASKSIELSKKSQNLNKLKRKYKDHVNSTGNSNSDIQNQ